MSLDKLEKNTARWIVKCEDKSSDIFLGALAQTLFDDVKGVRVASLTKETLSISFDVATADDAQKIALIEQRAALLDDVKCEVIYKSVPEVPAEADFSSAPDLV